MEKGLLKQDEDDRERHSRDQARGADEPPVDGEDRAQAGNADCNDLLLQVTHCDQRPEEARILSGEDERGVHDEAGTDQRHDNPTQNLESYFLDVVAKARAGQETSGAQSGAKVAEYLRAGIKEPAASEKILEKLALPQAAQPVVPAKPAATGPKVDETKLSALTQAAPVVPIPVPEKPATKPEAPKPEELAKADEKLSSLLGKRK